MAADPAGGFAPRALATWRIATGAAVLVPLAWALHREAFLPCRADALRLAACALFGIVANQVLALEGVARTSIVHAGLLMTLIPVFTYALAVVVGQERYRGRRALGIVVALVGAALLVVERPGREGPLGGALLGNVLILLNGASYACYLVLARRLLRSHPSLVVIAWSFLFGLCALPFVGFGVELVPEAATDRAWQGLAYTLAIPTLLAYTLNTFALARVAASTAAAFIYLQPLVAGAAGIVWFGERPGGLVAAASGLLFLGIALVVASGARARSHPRSG